MFYQLSKFNCVSETNQTSNQNFPTPFFRERCQEDVDRVLPIKSDRKRTSVLWKIACYIRKTVHFLMSMNIPS